MIRNSIYVAILLSLIVQLFIALMIYEFKEIKHRYAKFIKKA